MCLGRLVDVGGTCVALPGVLRREMPLCVQEISLCIGGPCVERVVE